MSFSIARQIKLRSIEQANFTKSYNRVNFVVTPDGLATDLSSSYLSMRLYLLKNLSGLRVSNAEMLELIRDNLCVSFGNQDKSYSPACLFRTARLYALKGDELLEEINFSNVLTQSIMHQLCNDFETIEASNLLTGSSVQIGHGSSLPSTLSAFYKNPTEVHVFLRDIFGICRHSNFELAVTQGLRIEIELEDKQNLFKITTLGDFQQIDVRDASGVSPINTILPQRFAAQAGITTTLGYLQNADDLSTSCVARDQFKNARSNNLFVDGSDNIMVQYPKEGWEFPAATYFSQPAKGVQIQSIKFKPQLQYTTDQLFGLGFKAEAWMKLRYSISNSFTDARAIAPKAWYTMRKIILVDVDASGQASIVFDQDGSKSLEIPDVAGRTIDSDVVFDGLELLYESEVVPISYPLVAGTPTAEEMLTKLASNKLIVGATAVQRMRELGLLDADLRASGCTFDLGVELLGTQGASGETFITPDVITNQMSSAIRKVYSTQICKLPMQGAKCQIVHVGEADASGQREIEFSSWGCEGKTSLQPYLMIPTGDETRTLHLATSLEFLIWNVQNHLYAPNALDMSGVPIPSYWNDLTYEIDKFELVLYQNSVDPKNRMPSPFVYSTWKVEINTIENYQQTWSRQFILEQGVYNCFLLTPDWNTRDQEKGSMITSRRGVSHYRYLVNNIAQTNRDIYLQDFRSDYVSSLYLDRLNDTFANSDYILRSPVGIQGVHETAHPVVMYPLKIYDAVSETMYKMGEPGGATVQINLYGDPSMTRLITSGNVYFFKQLLKQI